MHNSGVARWFLTSILLFAAPAFAGKAAPLQGVVNINTASSEELELLPGVGPAKARLIIEYRQKHAFRTVEELARVKGIGPKTVRRLRPNLVVRGATTAQAGTGAPLTAAPQAGRPAWGPRPPSPPQTGRGRTISATPPTAFTRTSSKSPLAGLLHGSLRVRSPACQGHPCSRL